MVRKEEILVIRMAPNDKKRIATAAEYRGESITNFVTRTALQKAKEVLSRKEKTMETSTVPKHMGVPTFFKALCLTASQGGAHSYKHVGYSFGGATEGEQPWDANQEEWNEMLQEVQKYIKNGDRDNIWRWYRKVYPNAMKLVPIQRKDSFVNGILEAYNDGKLWFL